MHPGSQLPPETRVGELDAVALGHQRGDCGLGRGLGEQHEFHSIFRGNRAKLIDELFRQWFVFERPTRRAAASDCLEQ